MTVKDVLSGFAAALAVFVTVLLLASPAAHAAPMSMLKPAAVAVSHVQSPQQATCAAFAMWERHPTMGRLNRLVAASLRLPKSYLRADVGQLNADASSPKGSKYVSDDTQYVYEDCHDDSGL